MIVLLLPVACVDYYVLALSYFDAAAAVVVLKLFSIIKIYARFASMLLVITIAISLCISVFWFSISYRMQCFQDTTKARKLPKRVLPIICFREGSPPLPDASNTSIIDSGCLTWL